jgi:SSS family solute:Na+ symporter
MVVFGFLRTEQSAWWNILAWTLRNGATFSPVLAALFWPLATKRAGVSAMIGGFLAGLTWYHLGGWQPDSFYLGVHPVWPGMSVNLSVLVLVTLVETAGDWHLGAVNTVQRWWGRICLIAAAGIASGSVSGWNWLHANGLSGLAIFTMISLLSISTFIFVRAVKQAVSMEAKLGAGS